MSELVVMPKADWQAALDATRAKTGKTDLIKSGDLAGEIESISAGGGEEEVNVAKGIIERTIIEISDDTVEQIGDYAFCYCKTLTSVNFPNATSIAARAFYTCEALTEANIPNATGYIGTNAFYGCKALKSINFPKIEGLYSYAFYDCDALTDVFLPSVTVIESCAFQNSGRLKTVNIPNATNIRGSVFANCNYLTSVNMVSATNIDTRVFSYDRSLKSVYLPATPPTLANTNAFDGINAACVFYIPTGSLAAYQAATNWSALTSTYTFTEEDR